MKVLVTGGAGFIGSHLTERLVKEGFSVTVYDNFSTGKMKNLKKIKGNIRIIKADIRDFSRLLDAMRGVSEVYHLAAVASVSSEDSKLLYEVNAFGTLNVLEAARRQGVKRIAFASSAAVYGNQLLPLRESCGHRPISHYALSKVMGEICCLNFQKNYGLEASILRYFNVYGPRQSEGVIARFVDAVKKGKAVTIYGDGLQTRDFIHVADAVEATIKIQSAIKAQSATKNQSGIFNIATGKTTRVIDLVRIIERIKKKKIRIKFARERAGEIKHSAADISKMSKLKIRPKHTLEGYLKSCFYG